MIRARLFHTLGTLVLALPATLAAQVVGRTAPPPSTLTAPPPSTLTIRPPSSLPQIRMGSVPPRGVSGWHDGRFDGRPWNAVGGCWDGSLGCVGFKHGRVRGAYTTVPYWIHTTIPYEVPVYVPVPVPVAAPAPAVTPKVYDPTKSRMLTIGAGADGGAGVMRIERLEGNTLRLTWRGTTQPVKEARFFLADSAQRTLRAARVDNETPSALFEIGEIARRIGYIGLTVVFVDGAVQTTLVPYPPPEQKPE